MKLVNKFLCWYMFPINHPDLKPPLLWKIVFMISYPFILGYLVYMLLLGAKCVHDTERVKFKSEYQKYLKEKEK
jgi:hypothetical protein